MLRGEYHHRVSNRNARRMDVRHPIFRERGRENEMGRSWGVVQTKWNGVNCTHSQNSRDQIGTGFRS